MCRYSGDKFGTKWTKFLDKNGGVTSKMSKISKCAGILLDKNGGVTIQNVQAWTKKICLCFPLSRFCPDILLRLYFLDKIKKKIVIREKNQNI